MGFFKKSRHVKKRGADFNLPEQEMAPLEYKIKPQGFVDASHALTAEEVLGDTAAQSTPQTIKMSGGKVPVSPLDALRRRVADNAAVQKAEKEAETHNKAVPQVNAVPVTVTPSYTPKSDSRAENDSSLLEKCMPFIADGGGMPEEKPAYTLESVDSIINLTEQRFAKLFDELEIDRSKVSYDSLSAEKDTAQSASNETKPVKIEARNYFALNEPASRH